jgi:hypothetical protein
MRSKTEWTTVDNNGKKTPQRVGLAPEQGKGVEYEFDLLVEISTEHIANVIKDRTGKFQDKLIDRPGEDFGQQLAAWLADGLPSPVVSAQTPARTADATGGTGGGLPVEEPLAIRIATHISQAGSVRTLGKIADRIDVLTSEGQLSAEERAELREAIARRHDVIEPEVAVDAVA